MGEKVLDLETIGWGGGELRDGVEEGGQAQEAHFSNNTRYSIFSKMVNYLTKKSSKS